MEVLKVRLLDTLRETAAVQFAVLYSAKTIDSLVFVELVGHRHYVATFVGTLSTGLKGSCLFLEKRLAIGGEGEEAGASVDGDSE